MKKRLAKLALWFLKNTKYCDEATKNMILSEAVSHLFNTITVEDVLKENPDGTLQFEGKTLDASRKKDLKEQAELLPNLLLWKVIQKDIQYQINRKLYNEANITTDMLWGKLILYYNDIIKTRIEKFKSYRE